MLSDEQWVSVREQITGNCCFGVLKTIFIAVPEYPRLLKMRHVWPSYILAGEKNNPPHLCWVVPLCHSWHLLSPMDKMAAISQTIFSDAFFVNKKFCILIEISLKFPPKGPIAENPALVEIMAWRRIGDKPLSEPMLTRFTDAYMRH